MKRLAATALFVSLACAGAAHAADAPGLLGQNLAGEVCHLESRPSMVKSTAILCGDKPVDAGAIRVAALPALAADPAVRLNTIMASAEAMRREEDEDAACGPAQDLGNGIALSLCTLSGTGWPHVIVAGASQSALYEADGMPAMLPVLVRAVVSLAGQGDPSAAIAAGRKLVSARVPEGVLHASANDAAGYKNYVEIGRLAGGADDYAGAEAAYRHALEIETRLFGADSMPVGQTLAELALQVSNQGRFDEAAALFQRASPIIQGSSDPASRARLASYLALDAANQRKFEDALKLARQATAERRAALAASNNPIDPDAAPQAQGELSHSLRLEAEMALKLGDLPAARAAAEEALWIVFQEPGLPLWWRPDTLSLMGDINAASGRVVAAEHNLRDAVDLDKKLFGDAAPTAAAEIHLGAFYSGQEVYAAALAAYREAFRILASDKIARGHVVADQLLPYFAAAQAQKAPDAEIFAAAQFVGGGVSDQTIARMAAREAATTPALAKLMREVQDASRARDTARVELAAETSKADEDRSAAKVAAFKKDFDAACARYDALAGRLASEFPAYARLAAPGPASLADVQHALAPGGAFLSFVIGAKGGYALLAKPDTLVVRKLDVKAPDLAADIADLRKAFVPTLGRLPAFNLKASYALYRKLLGPLEPDLAGVNALTVAPSPELASLPLSLLTTAPSQDGDYAQAPWLIRRMAISDVPSPRAFLALARAEEAASPAPRPLLAFAAPNFEGGKPLDSLASACIESGPISPALLRALPPLPEAAGEAEKVAKALGASPGAVLTGAAASEAALHTHNLSNYAVLYFATHGLLPGELHCQSQPALALSPPSHAISTDDDGLLTAGEVAGLNLNADLVVLSACNTAAGGGGRMGGGALEGLADAFFEAGARAVLASHWEVPSAHTVSLMSDLFAHYASDRRQGLAAALREAQLALIANPASAHPFDWAAFTLIGDGAPVSPAASQQARADQ